ncbi:MAG: HEAT repeat domain-containing protein [Candidatus Methanoperedens sp.]|nr:HEAT repeat domain-containing protein [Candidatus Methanoperedens sp.]
MKKRQDIEGLVNILETGDIKECREAICMLGELRTRKAITPLIGFLETDDVQIRSNAAWALGEIGHVKAVLPLIGLLNDPIENVRINAAWSLGRIGDKRALSVLKSAVKNGSSDLRKHAREAIARIESNGNDKWRNPHDSDIPDTVDIPIIAIEVPSNMDCKYISRVEDDESQTDYENMARFSKNVQIRDTSDSFSEEETRKIVLGLKDDSRGLVSVDILFRYNDNQGVERKSSSVWLQMSSLDGDHKTEREIERIDTRPKDTNRTGESSKRKAKIKHSRKPKPVDYDLPEVFDPIDKGETDYIEEEPDERIINKRITRKEKRHVVREIPQEDDRETLRPFRRSRKIPDESELDIESQEIPEPVIKEPEVEPVQRDVSQPEVEPVVQFEPKLSQPEIKPVQPEPKLSQPEVKPVQPDVSKPEVKPVQRDVSKPEIKPVQPEPKLSQPEVEPVQPDVSKPEVKSEAPVNPEIKPSTAPGRGNVNSAVQLLSDIGMSGMTNAASTVTQLSGDEAESLHSQLRTLPIDEMKDEITGLGDTVVMIGVELHGNGQAGEFKGAMQLYISSQNALDVANDLLCNTPETVIKEFNDDIISTLKETANIFGGQYISAISEYIEVPLTLKTPTFNSGNSSKIAESVLKEITGKIEFALATNLPLGNNRIGRLIMLVDPKSFDIIIQKLF